MYYSNKWNVASYTDYILFPANIDVNFLLFVTLFLKRNGHIRAAIKRKVEF